MRPGYANFRFSPGEQRRQELITEAADIARLSGTGGDEQPSQSANPSVILSVAATRLSGLFRLIGDRPRRLEAGVGKQG